MGVIDDYLVSGGEDTIYLEPEYRKTNDLNAFLKSEKLGKTDDLRDKLCNSAQHDFTAVEYFKFHWYCCSGDGWRSDLFR